MTEEATPSGRAVRSKGLKESLLDMARSLGLLAVLLAIVLFIGARYLLFPGHDEQMPPVDYSGVVSGFATLAHAPVLKPHELPTSWRANAARITHPTPATVAMHIGWVVPHERFAGLDEATGDPAALVASTLGKRGATVVGSQQIAGVSWDVRTSDRGERALTRTANGVTTVVTGNATNDELATLCGSLR